MIPMPMQIGEESRVPPSPCPNCGTLLDACNVIGDNVKGQTVSPQPDDSFSVCIKCGHLLGFNADLSVRELRPDEMLAIAGDKRMLAIQRARGLAAKDHPESWKAYDKYRSPDFKCGTSLSTPRGRQSKSSTPTIIHLPSKLPDLKSGK